MISSSLQMVKKPEVGLGVVGMKTVMRGTLSVLAQMGGALPVMRPKQKEPSFGNLTMTTCLKDLDWVPKMVRMTCWEAL